MMIVAVTALFVSVFLLVWLAATAPPRDPPWLNVTFHSDVESTDGSWEDVYTPND